MALAGIDSRTNLEIMIVVNFVIYLSSNLSLVRTRTMAGSLSNKVMQECTFFPELLFHYSDRRGLHVFLVCISHSLTLTSTRVL